MSEDACLTEYSQYLGDQAVFQASILKSGGNVLQRSGEVGGVRAILIAHGAK